MKTIKDIEVQLETKASEALKDLGILPQGYRCRARLHGKTRDKRGNASFEKSWSPDTDSIIIKFEPNPEQLQGGAQPLAQGGVAAPSDHAAKSSPLVTDRLSDLIRTLDRAESRRGYNFVALKWFRDTALTSEGFPWASVDSERHTVLRNAIDKRLILTSKVPNPKSPQFPVTAIRLNRLMPEVKAILEVPDQGLPNFQPVSIRGGNLSVTVLRDRR
jgi:hypothetical protein